MNLIKFKKNSLEIIPSVYVLMFAEFVGTIILLGYYFMNYNLLFLEPFAFAGSFELWLLHNAFEFKQPMFAVILLLFVIVKLVTLIYAFKGNDKFKLVSIIIYTIEGISIFLFILTFRISILWSVMYFLAELYGFVFDLLIILLLCINRGKKQSKDN